MNHYAKVSIRDLRGAADSLPKLSAPKPKTSEPLAATGTDPHPIKNHRAHYLPIGRDASTRNEAQPGAMALTGHGNENTPEAPTQQGLGRVSALPNGSITERGGFEPPIGFDTYNGLANRRFRPLSHLS